MQKKLLLLPLVFIAFNYTYSQVKIGNNPNAINANSILELEATNLGFVPPRVALVNVATPAPLAAGLLTSTIVYSTVNPVGGSGIGLYYWDGLKWNYIKNGGTTDSWMLVGNAGTAPATNFIGTTDAQDFVVRTNNLERARVLSTGLVGINTATPTNFLDVNGNINTGKASGNNGVLKFTTNNASGNTVTLQSGVTTASYALTLPTTQGGLNQVMTNNGGGTLTWASPTATIAQNAFFAYGTATNVISVAAFTPLTGLTITVTLTGTAVVWVHTDGGVQTQSNSTSGFSAIDVVMLVNGAFFANGGYNRITVVNNLGVVTTINFWSKDEIVTLAAGTYTFSVSAARNLGSPANVNGNNLSVLQGVLACAVYYL